jgi:hypothetical protein
MPDTEPGAPLDLSIFDNLDSSTPTMYEAREIAIERMQFEAAAAWSASTTARAPTAGTPL